MRYMGIVGHEKAKFTATTEDRARAIIRELLAPEDVVLVSGGCHLGGIDIWAEEEADKLGRTKVIYKPDVLTWDGFGFGGRGFKQRNLEIAEKSDVVHCIVVESMPATFKGRKRDYCYHCKTAAHVGSGGCWTAKRCKEAVWHVVSAGPVNE